MKTINRFSLQIGLRIVLLPIVTMFVSHAVMAEEDAATVIESFVKHVAELDSVSSAQRDEIQKIVDEYALDSPADAITESLIAVYDGYAAAVEASDGENLPATLRLLMPFADSDDMFLSADASFYLARVLMNDEKFEEAIPLLERVHGELSDYSVHVGHARFYVGIAQAGLLKYDEAVKTLVDFLEFYPDAPERLRVAAWRQAQQLQSIKEGQMDDIYQRMDFSRRRLFLIEPGEETQHQQDKIVKMLAKLIKEQEKKEASSNSKSQKNTQKQQQQQQQAKKKRQQSKSQTGGKSNNANGRVVRKSYNDGPASPWSRLRDRSRDPANNAIKDKLPARYRNIVERYYEAANGDSNK